MLPREEIYERVWGYSMVHGDRSVDVFVRKLRQKLEKVSPDWRYIHTHFGIGYRFAAERTDGVDVEVPAAAAVPAAERVAGADEYVPVVDRRPRAILAAWARTAASTSATS